MKIVYYKSVLCPRCLPTNRLMARLKKEHPEIEIEEVEVLTHLARARQDDVHTLPTLDVGSQRFHHAPRLDELLAALRARDETAPAVSTA
jgi:glutaredoxin